jgi:hypothetical protein
MPTSRRPDLRRGESAQVLATMKTWLWNQATLKSLSIAAEESAAQVPRP